jgi:hypothetical protein
MYSCSQGQINSLWGPRPEFSAGPQSTENVMGCVCVRCFIIYVMQKCLCKSHLFFFSWILT